MNTQVTLRLKVLVQVRKHAVQKKQSIGCIASCTLGLGLGPISDKKEDGLPSPRAEAGQENIETVHEPKPIQTAGSL